MSNMSWLLCDVRWTWLNNQMAKPDIGAIGPFGRRNKYIKHRTADSIDGAANPSEPRRGMPLAPVSGIGLGGHGRLGRREIWRALQYIRKLLVFWCVFWLIIEISR